MSAILRREEVRLMELRHAGLPLMERAGQAAAGCAARMLAARQGCVLVLAGPGNNGGDGFVLARVLREQGHEVIVACLAEGAQMPPDARQARAAWQAAGGQVVSEFVGSNWALIVDAIFGIGLKRPPEGRYADWIARLSQMSAPVLSLDVPSGLDADTGRVLGAAVRASHTATFIAMKAGLLTLNGPDHCGELSLHSLDLPAEAAPGRVLGREFFAAALLPRAANVHKGLFGQAGVIGGATGMVGAALLTARAALMAGAGRVYGGVLDAGGPVVDFMQPEIMLRAATDLHLLCSALAVGPGMGLSEIAAQQLRRAVAFSGPLLLDADALTLLGQSPQLQSALARRDVPAILTPHPAEAARLMQCATSDVQNDRVSMALEMARRYQSHVVLKGAGSVVALRDGRWLINTTGNAGLATAGSGDVLSGLVLGLLAQGWEPALALAAGVHLHGAAADWLSGQGVGPVGLTASEIAPAARRLLNMWLVQGEG
ncbi:NAD(P)H-hydrate dehydratase [Viridibacterium curvum]|uniref:Bifunctional NAD(P)H-hydrate repair enzyme n=1 Tax=Viridibacterium curvum TaxID=1101404 RepID=A0ABP9QF16_9RHOO